MKIQLICNQHNLSEEERKHYSISSLSSPKSLGEYEINVIDLSSENLWRTDIDSRKTINVANDLYSLNTMISHSKNSSNILIVLPQNIKFRYRFHLDHYEKSCYLKDMIEDLYRILSNIFPSNEYFYSFRYENTTSKIKNIEYVSAFCFDNINCENDTVTKSIGNEATTIKFYNSNVFLTSLDVTKSGLHLYFFLQTLFPPVPTEDMPDWVKEYSFFNDEQLIAEIENSKETISNAKRIIDASVKKLNENNMYKSILYTNGNELVEVVFKILERILDCDLSDFVDEKREDFNIMIDGITYIGEIKGVTSNIKNEFISQVDVHYQGYMDKLEDEGRTENVKQVLIVNPFRTKPLEQREPVNQRQIELASRNKCLIIETKTLLKMYEKFLRGNLSVEDCRKMFAEEDGLLAL